MKLDKIGPWSEIKLEIVTKYIREYKTKKRQAQYLAGRGKIEIVEGKG